MANDRSNGVTVPCMISASSRSAASNAPRLPKALPAWSNVPWLLEICPEMHVVAKMANLAKICQSVRRKQMSWPKGPVESGEFGKSGEFGENGKVGENLAKGLTKEMIWVEGPQRKRRIWR